MKTHLTRLLNLLSLAILNVEISTYLPQSTTFTHHGRLNNNGVPVTARTTCSSRFTMPTRLIAGQPMDIIETKPPTPPLGGRK
jgi:hypothetical protein